MYLYKYIYICTGKQKDYTQIITHEKEKEKISFKAVTIKLLKLVTIWTVGRRLISKIITGILTHITNRKCYL